MFLKVSFHRPHSPYDPPKRLHDKYKSLLADLPARHLCEEGGWDEVNKNITEMFDNAWCGDAGDHEARLSRAGYYGSIDFVDENVGKVLDSLDAQGVLNDMWIVWTSDHGDEQHDHYLLRKGFPTDSSARVPMVVAWPISEESTFGPSGRVISNLVEMRDVGPTMWDIAGILDDVLAKDPLVSGKSVLPLLTGELQR